MSKDSELATLMAKIMEIVSNANMPIICMIDVPDQGVRTVDNVRRVESNLLMGLVLSLMERDLIGVLVRLPKLSNTCCPKHFYLQVFLSFLRVHYQDLGKEDEFFNLAIEIVENVADHKFDDPEEDEYHDIWTEFIENMDIKDVD